MRFKNSIHLNKNQKGITLVALIITIVILLILTVIAINSISGTGIISKAEQTAFITRVKNYEEELMLYITNKEMETLYMYDEDALIADKTTTPSIKDIIKSMNEEDAEKFSIESGKLVYIGTDSHEQEWSGNLGLQVGYTIKRIYGNSIQNETPSLTNPAEIQSVGDKTKNLLKPTENVIGSLLVDSGSIHNINYVTTTDYISLKAGTYTISYKTGANLRNICWFDQNKEIVGYVWSNRQNPYTFTIDNDYLVRFDIERNGNVAIENLETFFTEYEVQLEEGSTATPYEPYGYKIPVKGINEVGETVVTNVYINEPLRKIGEYADYIDFESGKIIRNINYVDLSTLSWTRRTNTTDYYIGKKLNFLETYSNNEFPKVKPPIMSDYFSVATRYDMYNKLMTVPSVSHYILNNEKVISMCYPGFSEVDDFVEAIKGKNIYYVLPTLDDTETIEIPNITKIIKIETQIQPSNIEK